MLGGLVYALFGLADLIIGVRFVFLLLGANPASSFVTWIYQWSSPLVAPFNGIFGNHVVAAGPGVVVHSIWDWSSLVALIIYGALGGILARILASV